MDDIVNFIIGNSGQIVSGVGVLILAIIQKFRKSWKSKLNIEGQWQGMSIYIPLQNDSDHECIYKLRVTIKQNGPYIKFKESIYEIFDDQHTLMQRPERIVKGQGKFHGDKDIIIRLQEQKGLTCGVIYMISDYWGNELSGYIVVTNPFDGKPVVVRILLRRAGNQIVKVDDLKFEELKFIHDKFLI